MLHEVIKSEMCFPYDVMQVSCGLTGTVIPVLAHVHKQRLHSMPNPCTVTVNEASIGITTVDVLKHFTSEEIARAAGQSDRMGRLANHLIEQRR